jgi:hypothetical protein
MRSFLKKTGVVQHYNIQIDKTCENANAAAIEKFEKRKSNCSKA